MIHAHSKLKLEVDRILGIKMKKHGSELLFDLEYDNGEFDIEDDTESMTKNLTKSLLAGTIYECVVYRMGKSSTAESLVKQLTKKAEPYLKDERKLYNKAMLLESTERVNKLDVVSGVKVNTETYCITGINNAIMGSDIKCKVLNVTADNMYFGAFRSESLATSISCKEARFKYGSALFDCLLYTEKSVAYIKVGKIIVEDRVPEDYLEQIITKLCFDRLLHMYSDMWTPIPLGEFGRLYISLDTKQTNVACRAIKQSIRITDSDYNYKYNWSDIVYMFWSAICGVSRSEVVNKAVKSDMDTFYINKMIMAQDIVKLKVALDLYELPHVNKKILWNLIGELLTEVCHTNNSNEALDMVAIGFYNKTFMRVYDDLSTVEGKKSMLSKDWKNIERRVRKALIAM